MFTGCQTSHVLAAYHRALNDPDKVSTLMSFHSGGESLDEGLAFDRSETGIGGVLVGLGMGRELNSALVVSIFSAKHEAGQQLTLMAEGREVIWEM